MFPPRGRGLKVIDFDDDIVAGVSPAWAGTEAGNGSAAES